MVYLIYRHCPALTALLCVHLYHQTCIIAHERQKWQPQVKQYFVVCRFIYNVCITRSTCITKTGSYTNWTNNQVEIKLKWNANDMNAILIYWHLSQMYLWIATSRFALHKSIILLWRRKALGCHQNERCEWDRVSIHCLSVNWFVVHHLFWWD